MGLKTTKKRVKPKDAIHEVHCSCFKYWMGYSICAKSWHHFLPQKMSQNRKIGGYLTEITLDSSTMFYRQSPIDQKKSDLRRELQHNGRKVKTLHSWSLTAHPWKVTEIQKVKDRFPTILLHGRHAKFRGSSPINEAQLAPTMASFVAHLSVTHLVLH